jgi:hypothetical protein
MYRLLSAIILLSGCSLLPEREINPIIPVMVSCEIPERLMRPVPENQRPRFEVLDCEDESRWALKRGHELKYINLLKRDKAWREVAKDYTAPLQLLPMPDEPAPWYWPF